ncbi:hypothetical protein Mapa_017102 [Marchantia paleacea]|nr:hypothetical protein Mapa_017102 [Marchantia paleacea]
MSDLTAALMNMSLRGSAERARAITSQERSKERGKERKKLNTQELCTPGLQACNNPAINAALSDIALYTSTYTCRSRYIQYLDPFLGIWGCQE